MIKLIPIACLCFALAGCASGQLDILDQQGKKIGECRADFAFHWHGARDSVNYILYLCAKAHVEKGRRVSDTAIFDLDYTLPPAPPEGPWNKLRVKLAFAKGELSEQTLGYLLAHLEYAYWQDVKEANRRLKANLINEQEHRVLIQKARLAFEGE